MSYKKAVEFTVRQVGTVLKPKFALILSDTLVLDVTDESMTDINKIARSWLKDPYIGSSRGISPKTIRPEWHPIVCRFRVPCLPSQDISKVIRDEVKIVSLDPSVEDV